MLDPVPDAHHTLPQGAVGSCYLLLHLLVRDPITRRDLVIPILPEGKE